MYYYYNYDEIPLYSWRKCMEKQDFKFTRKDILKGTDKEDADAWMKIYDTYLSERGFCKDLTYILDLKNEKMNLELEFAETGELFLTNQIRRLDVEISEHLENGKGLSIDEILIHLSKFMGYRINQKETTAKEFYNLIDVYTSQSKEK